jgi:pimeloyl-ACP methyl ester carboxylesterase
VSRFRTSDGVELNATDDGGSGIPMVFQHGLGADEKQPREVFPDGPGYRRLTLECRGHGQSDAGDPRAFSLSQFSDDLASFIERKFTAPVVVGGISMGAALTLILATRRPELVKAVVLARPAWLLSAAPGNMRPNAYVGELLTRGNAATALEEFEQSEVAREVAAVSPDNIDSLRGFLARPDRSILSALLVRISADGPRVEEAQLRRLTVPALMIGTDADYVHPFAYAATLAHTIPGARLTKITPKSLSRPTYVEQFKAALTTFLNHIGA